MADSDIRYGKIHDVAFFGLRLAVGSIFIVAGSFKLDASVIPYLQQMGLPTQLQYLYAIQEIIPGILLISGVLSRISGVVLSLVMLGVIFYINKLSQFVGPNGIETPVMLLAASSVLIVTGPGKISISHLIKRVPRFLQ